MTECYFINNLSTLSHNCKLVVENYWTHKISYNLIQVPLKKYMTNYEIIKFVAAIKKNNINTQKLKKTNHHCVHCKATYFYKLNIILTLVMNKLLIPNFQSNCTYIETFKLNTVSSQQAVLLFLKISFLIFQPFYITLI